MKLGHDGQITISSVSHAANVSGPITCLSPRVPGDKPGKKTTLELYSMSSNGYSLWGLTDDGHSALKLHILKGLKSMKRCNRVREDRDSLMAIPRAVSTFCDYTGAISSVLFCDLNLDIDWCHLLSDWQAAQMENLPPQTHGLFLEPGQIRRWTTGSAFRRLFYQDKSVIIFLTRHELLNCFAVVIVTECPKGFKDILCRLTAISLWTRCELFGEWGLMQ